MQGNATELTSKIEDVKIRREKRRRKRRMKKAVISAVTAACILVSTAACIGIRAQLKAEAGNKTDVRETTNGSLSGKTVILHSNDVHGSIDGYSRMASLRKGFEEDGAEVIVADAGDFSGKTPEGGTVGALEGFMMMRLAGYDLATLGDAEFDQGYEKLRHDISGAKLRLLCANVFKGDKGFLTSDYIYETSKGVKIGFFGLTSPAVCDGLTFLSGDELMGAARTEADSLKKAGADTVIALTHLGSSAKKNSSVELYKKVKGIDFIIDGHTHDVITEGPGGEPIQSAGEGFSYIGVIVLNGKGEVEDHYVMSTDRITSDDDVQKEADKLKTHMSTGTTAKDKVVSNTIDDSSRSFAADSSSDKEGDDQRLETIKAETVRARSDRSEETETTDSAETADNAITADIAVTTEKTEKVESAETTESASDGLKASAPDTGEASQDTDAAAKVQTEEKQMISNNGKYEVVKGDCLWNIAKKHLGDGTRWQEIYELNKGIISNPSLIYVGQQLVLPPG